MLQTLPVIAERGSSIAIADYRVAPDATVDLAAWPTRPPLAERSRAVLRRKLRRRVRRFAALQEKLYAERRQALLLIFQGMDAAGKDSTVKYVTSGVNPQGFVITNFGPPTAEQLRHSWLQRHWAVLPGRGRIGIFNRSHYEEVVTLRAQPHLLAGRRLFAGAAHPQAAPTTRLIGETTSTAPPDEDFWQQRYSDIVAFEQHLATDGTTIVKFFLHISKEEQRQRLLRRLDDPAKRWKFDPSDVQARRLWDDYQSAYGAALGATSTATAPWYVIPADSKPAARVLVASIVVATLKAMAPRFPEPLATQQSELDAARKMLAIDEQDDGPQEG